MCVAISILLNVEIEIHFQMGHISSKSCTVCLLVLCQLHISYSHLTEGNLYWETASIRLDCRQAHRGLSLLTIDHP